MMMQAEADLIDHILQTTKTIAVVGFSRSPHRAGYYVPAYLQQAGYRIIPVNPTLTGEGLGEVLYSDLETIPGLVDMILVFRRSQFVPPIVDEAIKIGAKTVWMQSGIAHDQAAEKGKAAGLAVIMSRCMMVEHRRRNV